jgi:pimeloyl-ACP methyl ester carboxylesterase
MNLIKRVIILCLFASSLSGMESKRTAFNDLWPFEKLGTNYDEMFAALAPVFYRQGEGSQELLQAAYDYVETSESKTSLLPELKETLDRCTTNKNQKKQTLKILQYVFASNFGNHWNRSHLQDKAIIAYHGLGDTGNNFKTYVEALDNKAASFVPDFRDHDKKALNIGTELELIMAAYQYFVAKQQFKKLFPSTAMPEYLLGISRGGGVVARLSSKFKKDQEPTGGFIMLAPFISPADTIGHVAKETSIQSSGWGIKLPNWLVNLSIQSANASLEDRIEINSERPPVAKLRHPLLIIHGSKDRTIPFQVSENWAREHAKKGNDVYYHTVPGVDHNELFGEQTCLAYVKAFLTKDLSQLEPLRLK